MEIDSVLGRNKIVDQVTDQEQAVARASRLFFRQGWLPDEFFGAPYKICAHYIDNNRFFFCEELHFDAQVN